MQSPLRMLLWWTMSIDWQDPQSVVTDHTVSLVDYCCQVYEHVVDNNSFSIDTFLRLSCGQKRAAMDPLPCPLSKKNTSSIMVETVAHGTDKSRVLYVYIVLVCIRSGHII